MISTRGTANSKWLTPASRGFRIQHPHSKSAGRPAAERRIAVIIAPRDEVADFHSLAFFQTAVDSAVQAFGSLGSLDETARADRFLMRDWRTAKDHRKTSRGAMMTTFTLRVTCQARFALISSGVIRSPDAILTENRSPILQLET
jgi:hypothetical protein